MKITKTIDVSELTDEQIEAITTAKDLQGKVDQARIVVSKVVEVLRGANDHMHGRLSPYEMADAIEDVAKKAGLL